MRSAHHFFFACLSLASVGCFFQVGADAETAATAPPPSADAVVVGPGSTPEVSGNHQHVRLQPGVYHGDLYVSGNHCVLDGAGPGQTIIEGALTMSGNHNVVRGVTITGPSRITGNHNGTSAVEFRAGLDVAGQHNNE